MATMIVSFLGDMDEREMRHMPSTTGMSIIDKLRAGARQTVVPIPGVTVADEGASRLAVHVDDANTEAQRMVQKRINLMAPKGKLLSVVYDHPYVGEHI